MTTIPASTVAQVIPGVISAGGNSLVLNGLMLTTSTRVPIGTVFAFSDDDAVESFFGGGAPEVAEATVYFNGFDNSDAKPGSLLIAQYNQTAVAAYLRGGNAAAALTLTQLQALTGTLAITVDGYPHSATSFSLSSASSFSAAATLIQTALTATEPTEASFTASIGASFTATGTGTALAVSGITGKLFVGDAISGTGIPANTVIATAPVGNGNGAYTTNNVTTASTAACTSTSNTLAVSAVGSGVIAAGQTLAGATVAANTLIKSQVDGSTGGVGDYLLSGAQQAIASEAMTGVATAPTVAFDSVSGGFVITSGVTGAPSSVAYATGTLAAPLLLTQTTGALLSQGAAPASPATFMNGITNITQNWCTFWTLFDPDGGTGNANKYAFAQWNNGQNKRWLYSAWDPDLSPRATNSASGSLGAMIKTANLSGTAPISETTGEQAQGYAAFLAGAIASVDFTELEGRTTMKFRSQGGLVADTTDATTAANLAANGYNFYGAYATANQGFVFFANGVVSGPFAWIDSYINQIWMNNNFQLALMNFMTTRKSIPYDPPGYAAIETALADPINAAINFGAIRVGVVLSASEASQVNSDAGVKIDNVLTTQGWYLQVTDPGVVVRGQRGTPNCRFWYMDGESVQMIVLSSVLVQ